MSAARPKSELGSSDSRPSAARKPGHYRWRLLRNFGSAGSRQRPDWTYG
jgi:hypothetical protein